MKALTPLQKSVLEAVADELSNPSSAMLTALINELLAGTHRLEPDKFVDTVIGGPLNNSPKPGTLTIGALQEAVANDPELSAALDDLIEHIDIDNECAKPQLKYPNPNVPHRSTSYSIEQLVKVWGLMMGGVERSEIRSLCNISERNQANIEKTLVHYVSCANSLVGDDRTAYIESVSARFSAKETVTPANVDPPRSASTDQATTKGPNFPFGTGTSNKIVEFIRLNPDITPAECYRKLLETDRAQYVHGYASKLTDAWQDYKELAEV